MKNHNTSAPLRRLRQSSHRFLGQAALGIASLLATVPATISAQVVNLDFNSLPSAQNWHLITSGGGGFDATPRVPEASIFSADGQQLHQNTLGTDNLQALYYRNGVVDFTKDWTIEFTSRTVTQERGYDPYGFAVGVSSPNWVTHVSIGALGDIWDGNFTRISTTATTTLFHNYTMKGTSTGNFSLYIDGVFTGFGYGQAASLPAANIGLFFGDATPSGSNAKADLSSYRFSQIPEPSTYAALIATAVFLVICAQRYRAKGSEAPDSGQA